MEREEQICAQTLGDCKLVLFPEAALSDSQQQTLRP